MLNQERYGSEITQMVWDATDGKVDIQFGSLYPMLNKLTKRGLIQKAKGNYRHENLAERGGHRRQYYILTARGYAALDQIDVFRTSLRDMQSRVRSCF